MKKYEHIAISSEVFSKTAQTIEELEEIIRKNGLPVFSDKEKTHYKVKFINGKLTHKVDKLTMKIFTETALNYFIKYKIDPRFFDDNDSLTNQVVRLRNQIFSFLQVQERQHIMPINAVLAELKQREADKLVNENKHFSRHTLAYLVAFSTMFFETLDMKKEEIEAIKARLDLFHKEMFNQLNG